MTLTAAQTRVLRRFKGTGQYIGKDAHWKARPPLANTKLRTLMSLRNKGLIEHACANQWFLTEKGRDYLHYLETAGRK